MRKQALRAVTMLITIIALAFATAVASNAAQGGNSIKADIPFDFVVGSKTLAAGEYSIGSFTADGAAMRVSRSDGSNNAIRLSNSIVAPRPKQKSMLTFRRYGNTYFLAEVWVAGSTQGRELLKSKGERAAEQLARNSSGTDLASAKPEIVTIIADVE
jgi:hypothetical protein